MAGGKRGKDDRKIRLTPFNARISFMNNFLGTSTVPVEPYCFSKTYSRSRTIPVSFRKRIAFRIHPVRKLFSAGNVYSRIRIVQYFKIIKILKQTKG
jgi:hypothetical protein